MSLEIERVAIEAEESQRLMAELWRELDALYGNELPTGSHLAGMEQRGAAFIIARREGRAVGCAALRPLTNAVAEVKRIFVQPHARRSGVARALMAELERLARAAGFSEIWLETGQRQPSALRLYESLGYKRIAGFGEYKHDPLSICFAKPLRSPPSSAAGRNAVD